MARGRLPKVGTYTGSGAAISIDLGYEPLAVVIYNETDGDGMWLAISGQADDKALQILDTGAGTTDLSFLASNGVTIQKRGFSVGTSVSESAKVFRYVAI